MLPILILAIEDDSDRVFMTTVYFQHRTMMLRVIRKTGCGYQDAEDVMHESLIRLIDNLPTLRELNEHSLRKYVLSTVKTTAISYAIKQSKNTQNEYMPHHGLDDIPEGTEKNPENIVIQLSEMERLKTVLKTLPKYEYEILFMREYDGLTDQEIADILNKKENSVRTYASRAYKHARELLSQD